MKRIMFVTGHYYRSHRRGGVHWLARSFHRAGWDIFFFTAGLSSISRAAGDHRFQYPVITEANQIHRIEERFSSFVWFTPWHPVSLRSRLANCLAAPLFSRYGNLSLFDAADKIAEMDVIMIESGVGLMLFDRLKKLNPSARFVYRLSDDLRVLNVSPLLIETERRIAPDFDLITAPSTRLLKRFEILQNTAVHPQGLDADLFDLEHDDPYDDKSAPNLVSIGNMIYDIDFLERASRLFQDWRFHVIGWLKRIPCNPNVIYYGEKPFEKVIPFVKFADVGLSPYLHRPGNEYLLHSSHKILQYTYCRLPIVAPYFIMDSSQPHIVGYLPGEDISISKALTKAVGIDHGTIERSDFLSWDEIVRRLSDKIS